MNDFNSQSRPAKRPRESSCPPPGLGYRDNHEMPKNPDPRKHQEPKPMGPPARVETSTTERFRPLARELTMLDERNPFLADHAADLVMIFRRVWDSYTAGHTENSRLEKDNHRLQAENARLLKGQSEMEGRCRESGQPPRHFIEAIQKLQDGLKAIFEQWEKAINTDPSKQADTKEGGAVAGVGPSAP